MQHGRTIMLGLRDQAIRELQTETCAGPITYWNGFRDAMSLALQATKPQHQSVKEELIAAGYDADDGPDGKTEVVHGPDQPFAKRDTPRRPNPTNDLPTDT